MASVFLGLMTTLSSTLIWQDPVNYYCGEKTFSETPVSVSKSSKFVADIAAEPLQNISLLLESSSFVLDVTGCLTPKGILRPAIGIEIVNETLPILYSGAVQNLIVLEMIKIEYCGVQDIHPGAFMILPAIHTMLLRFNRLVYIKEGVFNHLRVAKLYLSNNSISYIENEAFDDMPNLRLLNLDSNRLKNWNSDWFTNTPNVQTLSVDSNELTKIPANAFNKLRNFHFTNIRLSNNNISYIHPRSFQKLHLLYALWLDNNLLFEIDPSAFVHLEQLYILSLTGNKIKCLPIESFYAFKSPDMILRVENNEFMSCSCLKKIEVWAKSNEYLLTERFAKNECSKKKKQPLSNNTLRN
ncbi:hypothetical protein RN001_012688 [Aquatica leii]|uniref:Uncharacterized protein n=1 Tax=Aquatica leii TaxID=1421715 RepID=A0AAN7P6K0_9COLE|nr:hypothetical protein RN001_012688 [Aquatica leii]